MHIEEMHYHGWKSENGDEHINIFKRRCIIKLNKYLFKLANQV